MSRAVNDERYESLLVDVNAPEIAAAAAGLRPEIADTDALPLVGGKLRMAPASASYKVARNGDGTEVTLFGVTAEGHSCAVRVNGFYPYMYVHLGDADPGKLVAELDATLLAMLAIEGERRQWAPEYRAICASLVGTVRKADKHHLVLTAFGDGSCRPVIGWELVDGTLLRGSGAERGYRGLEARRFIKIYFYMPGFVPKAKQILHGTHNEFGALHQAEKLATSRSSMADRLAAEAAAAVEQQQQEAAARATKRPGKEYGRLRYLDGEFAKKWVPHGDTGEGDGAESSDDENGDDVGDAELLAAAAVEDVVADEDEVPLVLDEKHAIRPEQIATTLYENELQDESMFLDRPLKDEDVWREEKDRRWEDFEAEGERREQRWSAPRSRYAELGRDANTDEGRERLEKLANDLLHRRAREELTATRGPLVRDSYLNQADKEHTFTVCEADIDFTLRLAIDSGWSYNQFIEIDMERALERANCHAPRALGCGVPPHSVAWSPPDTPPGVAPLLPVALRATGYAKTRTTSMQIEIYCDYHHIRLSPDAALQRSVPNRVTLSLDSEMATNGTFPRPDTHAVLQVGCVLPLPSGKRREVGFTVGRLARGPGEYIDELPHAGAKRTRDDDAEVVAALTRRRFKPALDAGVESEHVLCFETESMMLLGLANFVRVLAPDIVITFNGDNFDMPYLAERAAVLGVDKQFMAAWGASLADPRIKIRDRSFATTAIGKHEYKEVTAAGRLFYDLFQYWKRNPMLKERSYSLNSLSKRYLKMEKENVAYSQIDTLQLTPEGRRKLLRYCIRDALLPVLLDQRQTIGFELLEKSRGTGVPIEMLLKRGMQIQCKTYLYRKSRIGILVPALAAGMPTISDAGQRRPAFWYTRTDAERRIEMHGPKFDGATVIDPRRGLHDEPVVTLDFRALYPSIMASGNYCLSTVIAPNFNVKNDTYFAHLVASGQRTWDELFMAVGTVTYDAKSTSVDYDEKIDAGSTRFIRHDVLRGFVPDIERELLLWRDAVKAELKAVKAQLKAAEAAYEARLEVELDACLDVRRAEIARLAELYTVLDKRQLSIKLIANSLYGVFGAKTSFAFCLDLADSVTRRGRAAILLARWLTLHVINDITPEHPIARRVAEFPGLKNKLVALDPGAEVVAKLCAEMAEARKSKPRVRKAGVKTRTNDLRSQFGAMTRQAPAAPSAAEGEIDDSVRISCVYGDTDSLFIGFWKGIDFNQVGRIAILMAQFISITLHQRWPTRVADDNLYQFDVEKAFRVIIFFAKKRYAGLKYLWDGKAFTPADPKDPFKPSESGLETQRRDTTRLVSERMSAVISMLCDYRYAKEEKLRRAISYIYFTMVEPLRKGTIQKRLIVQTRQLRKLPSEYLATNGGVETSLPVHVQMALRAEREKGAAEAPKSGDRIAFIVVKGGGKDEKSSSRGVDPVEVLQDDREIDGDYYLEKHVAPAICRIFEPIIVADRTDIPGATDKARQTERMALTHEAVFGSRAGYQKPAYADEYRGAVSEYMERNEFVRAGSKGLVRYHKRSQVVERTFGDELAHMAVAGERCATCRGFFVGEARGFVCAECVAQNVADARRRARAHLAERHADIEELAVERAAIYEHCQCCAHTERCPTPVITCDESQCDTFWERKENEKALREADRLAATATRALAAQYEEYC